MESKIHEPCGCNLCDINSKRIQSHASIRGQSVDYILNIKYTDDWARENKFMGISEVEIN